MAKIKGRIVGSVKRKPKKAGSTPRPHGGFPTGKIIAIRAKILSDIEKKGK